MEESVKKVLLSLQRLCVKRECCSDEIYRKALQKVDGDAAAAGEILGSLKADAFVDDARYAAAFAREKSSLSGWGPIKIRFALRGKGVGEAEISAALEGIDAEKAEARLLKDLAAKWKTLEGESDAKLRLIKYALAKGYGYDAVQSAVERTVCDG